MYGAPSWLQAVFLTTRGLVEAFYGVSESRSGAISMRLGSGICTLCRWEGFIILRLPRRLLLVRQGNKLNVNRSYSNTVVDFVARNANI